MYSFKKISLSDRVVSDESDKELSDKALSDKALSDKALSDVSIVRVFLVFLCLCLRFIIFILCLPFKFNYRFIQIIVK